jgi:hypothetical protein
MKLLDTFRRLRNRAGSALLLTLAVLVIVAIITTAYLSSIEIETRAADSALQQQKAYEIAMMGVHDGLAKLRAALGPWDDPYASFSETPPDYYWSVAPGLFIKWAFDQDAPLEKVALFSQSSDSAEGVEDNLVDLNRRLIDGSYPIIGGANPPPLKVKWTNVLKSPFAPAGADNPVVGRYAYWIDDESAKINVNAADGTSKYTSQSLGQGAPAEVSLEAISGVTKNLARSIVDKARKEGFLSARSILGVKEAPPESLYTDNVFSLTTWSRSPELNIFGEPRLAMMPILGSYQQDSTDMLINGVTLHREKEIYPTPAQLPKYQMPEIVNLAGTLNGRGKPTVLSNPKDLKVDWPLAFRGAVGIYNFGRDTVAQLGDYLYNDSNSYYSTGCILANYLGGRNAAGKVIKWPKFSGSSAEGFEGKYTKRQIDSIAAQITSLGSKAISYDYPFTDFENNAGYMEHRGRYTAMAPFIFPGWLSHEWVSGMGRSPKVSGLAFRVNAKGATTAQTSSPNYRPPSAAVDIWVEYWVPSGYLGGTRNLSIFDAQIALSTRGFSMLNIADLFGHGGEEQGPGLAPLPADQNGNYWANQLLKNNQWIDFAANVSKNLDKRQDWASQLNPDKVPTPAMTYDAAKQKYVGSYAGANQQNNFGTPLWMPQLQASKISSTPDWQNGKARTIHNRWGSLSSFPMTTASTNGGTLEMSGGIAVITEMKAGHWTDPDPTPLEAWRGGYNSDTSRPSYTADSTSLSNEDYQNPADYDLGSGEKIEDRVRKAVIPVSLSVAIPGPGGFLSNKGASYASVKDPLVNKFPADWTANPNTPPTGMNLSGAANSAQEYTRSNSTLQDPDSYWMPQMDCPISRREDLKTCTLIPRSARMPSIGYLQYLRTGIMPDHNLDTAPYEEQKGTPFRLLSYAPVGDPAQKTEGGQGYPDWALLDLLYVPSILAPYGCPYPYSESTQYNSSKNDPGFEKEDANVTRLAKFGTYGGSTAGRINPNGVVAYTTSVDTPDPLIKRTLPLEAVFHGVKVGQKANASTQSWTGGQEVNAETLAGAVETYIRANGPFRMPGEICNVPEINNEKSSVNATRNDLVRQTIGVLTTQSNVFSVWVAGQAIQKRKSNFNYGKVEGGDVVLSDVRLHLVVERYLDPGADGVYGNVKDPGPDGVVGTYDDPCDSPGAYDAKDNNPFEPKYLYRVISSEQVL